MNLNSFEASFPLIILARGRAYFENGNVIDLEKVNSYQYEAEVAGSYTYDVTVKLDNNQNIVKLTCDCPYDAGFYCKHEAAVLFALREYIEDEIEESKEDVTSESGDEETFRDFLEAQPKATLVEFLYNLALSKPEIKLMAMATFLSSSGKIELEMEQMLISDAFSLLHKAHRYQVDEAFRALVGVMDTVTKKINILIDQELCSDALRLALMVLHEGVTGFLGTDGYEGEASALMDDYIKTIQSIITEESHERTQLFMRLFDEIKLPCYDDFPEYRYTLLDYCVLLVDSAEQQQLLEAYLQAMMREVESAPFFSSQMSADPSLLVLSRLKKKCSTPRAYKQFLIQHRTYPEVRRIAIELAFEEQRYDEVERWALEGEKQTPNYRVYNYSREWQTYRCKGYALSGNLVKQRALLRNMFFLYSDLQYYHELKDTYDTREWEAELQSLLEEMEQNLKKEKSFYFWSGRKLYTDILFHEGLKEKLLEVLKAHPSAIGHYYQTLLPDYATEVYSMFTQHIYSVAKGANKRGDYQRVCEIIRQLQKAGGEREADEIIKELQLLYRNRSAFRDELKRVALFN
ncbi:MAG: SWIM zinc finger family protein [Bacilli bacterium]